MLNNHPFYHNFIIKRKFCQGILAVLLILPLIINAALIDNLTKQIQEAEEKRAELERRAQEYQQIIDTKRAQIKSLNNEIAIFNARIGKLETEINWTESKISQTELEIIQLEYGLAQAEKDILYQKDVLAEIIRVINQYDETSDLEIILQSESLSDFFNQITYMESLQGRVQQTVEDLKYLKAKLTQDKADKKVKKQELEDLKERLTGQQNSLANQRARKKALLKYTQGEEKRYQQMLAHIEEQKKSLLGDINRLRQLKAAELARLKELLEKPPEEYWASINWYFRQDDPQWADLTIGLTDSTLADYGCAISSVAMVLKYHGVNVTPAKLAKEPIYYYDLIDWPKSYGGVDLIKNTRHRGVDWFRIDRELAVGYPVIIFVKANGRGAGHYVVIHHKTADGGYVVHDPLFGPNIYLDSTRVYISNLYQTTTSIDQMVIYH